MSQKILMIGNTAWGMLKFRGDLIRNYCNLGFSVTVIAPNDKWSIEIQDLGAEFIPIDVSRKGLNPFADLYYLLELTKILVKQRPTSCILYTIKPVIYGNIASFLAQVPSIISVITGLGYTFNKDNWLKKLTLFLYKFSLSFSKEIWFLNSDDQDIFINSKIIPMRKAFILPGEGVDINYFKPEVKLSPQFTFTVISRMLWDKGIGLFIEVARELKNENPDIQFVMAGPVDHGNPQSISEEQLLKWSQEDFIDYRGAIEDVRPLLRDTDCLIHVPFYREGLSRVLLEANSMGVPAITTSIPGCKDIIKDGYNGFVVSPRSNEDLKSAIKKFINLNILERKAFASNARTRVVENYSSDRIFNIYLSRII